MRSPRAALLVVALVLSVPLHAAEPPAASPSRDVEVERQLDQATAAKDWARAVALAEELNGPIEERHVASLHRIARLHALLGHGKEAYEWLKRAADAGVVDVYDVRKDEAFAFLRGDERFKALLRAMWVKAYVAMLERPEREGFQMPGKVMEALAFRAGERVADVGAGSGYFTLRVAKAVGPAGSVLAVDIAPELLEHLAGRARDAGLSNVKTQLVKKDDPQLPPRGVDTVLMVDMLHYVKAPDRGAYAKKLAAGLAPGGRVVVVDYVPKTPEERPWGPPPEQNMSRAEVDEAMAAAGLVPAKAHDFLPEQFFVEYRAR